MKDAAAIKINEGLVLSCLWLPYLFALNYYMHVFVVQGGSKRIFHGEIFNH